MREDIFPEKVLQLIEPYRKLRHNEDQTLNSQLDVLHNDGKNDISMYWYTRPMYQHRKNPFTTQIQEHENNVYKFVEELDAL